MHLEKKIKFKYANSPKLKQVSGKKFASCLEDIARSLKDKDFRDLSFREIECLFKGGIHVQISASKPRVKKVKEFSAKFKIGDTIELIRKTPWVDYGGETSSTIGDIEEIIGITLFPEEKSVQYTMKDSYNFWNECDCKLVKDKVSNK